MAQKGRKKGASGKISRALLLKIAAEEFSLHGFHLTKVSTIVARAGLTQPTFYLYFESKEAIFQELVDLFHNKLHNLTKNAQIEPGIDLTSIPERITTGIKTFFTFFYEEPNLARIGFSIAPEAEEIKNRLAAQIKNNLTTEQQAGYFHAYLDMSTVAESLVGIIERLTFTQLLTGNKDADDLANEIVQLFLYGMLVHKEL